MSEFKHWLDESSDANHFERAVLRSGLDADPPDARRDEIWASVLGSLSLAPLGTTVNHGAALGPTAPALKGAVGAAKAGAVWFGVGKGFVLGLTLCAAAAGVSNISEHLRSQRATPSAQRILAAAPAQSESASSRAVPATPEPEGAPRIATAFARPSGEALHRAAPSAASVPEPALSPQASEAPSVAAFDDPSPTRRGANEMRASQLEGEARALRNARAQLRAGRFADAFATLEASRRQFSAPELYQEREALTIELLARSGQIEAARQRATTFLSRFPESPHAARVQRFAAP